MPTANKYLDSAGVSRLSSNIKDYVDNQLLDITASEYDALTPEEKMDGTVYFCTDDEE